MKCAYQMLEVRIKYVSYLPFWNQKRAHIGTWQSLMFHFRYQGFSHLSNWSPSYKWKILEHGIKQSFYFIQKKNSGKHQLFWVGVYALLINNINTGQNFCFSKRFHIIIFADRIFTHLEEIEPFPWQYWLEYCNVVLSMTWGSFKNLVFMVFE